MNIYKINNNVYFDREFDLKLSDFDVEYSAIHGHEYSKKFTVAVELKPKDSDLRKALQELGFDEKSLRSGYRQEYNFRGRKTDEHKERAKQEAKDELRRKIESGKFERRSFKKLKAKFEERVKRNRESFMRASKNQFTQHDPIDWDGVNDEQLNDLNDELTKVQDRMNELKERRAQLKEQRRIRKNVLFEEFLNDHRLEEAFGKSTFPMEVDEILKEKARNKELFRVQRMNFLA